MNRSAVVAVALLVGGCRGTARPASEDAALARLVDSLTPQVERAVGLPFKRRPRARMITREQAAAFVQRQLTTQLGGGRGQHLATSYRLLGLVPDSTDLARLLGAVLAEQVAGYYDPDSSAFFAVRGASGAAFRITVAHELVHALQHDYVPLDSLVKAVDDGDRLLAAHSVLEGQATLAMFRMQPEVGDLVLDPSFWETAKSSARTQMAAMPQIAGAPRVIQESLLFPYLSGADYIRWWLRHHPASEQPYGAATPRSSEQILDPERVERGDVPLEVTFAGADSALFHESLGAAGMRVFLAEARGQAALDEPAVLGWGGDRFELYAAPGGEALVWIAVFDAPGGRDRALGALQRGWPRPRVGHRTESSALEVSGKPGLRLVVAPTEWRRWSALPTATAAPIP